MYLAVSRIIYPVYLLLLLKHFTRPRRSISFLGYAPLNGVRGCLSKVSGVLYAFSGVDIIIVL